MRIIIRAVNSKGVKVGGEGASLKDAAVAVIASSTRSNVEQCERNDLSAAVSMLSFLDDLGAANDNDTAEIASEFWRGRCYWR